MNTSPQIEPTNMKEHTVKQSKYESVGKLPMRVIILGPSGSGKNTVLLQNMILDIYKDCFKRIYIFSPSVYVDSSWIPIGFFIENDMKVQRTDDDPIYFDHCVSEELHEILDTQHKIIEYTKKNKF